MQAAAQAGERVARTVDREGRKLAPPIDGVIVKRLQPHADHRGELLPVMDARDPF